MGAQHPEQPARMLAVEQALYDAGLLQKMRRFDAPKASKAQLARVHSRAYIERIFKQSPSAGLVQLDADTAMNPYSLEAALRASGAAALGVDLVMTQQAAHVFCNTRPPGHHAGRESSAGFCIFNHVAVAAAHAIAQYGLQRVAIADFDVHHGNGTENIFHDDPRVMLCSSFRHPYYPHSGADSGNHHIINTPLAAGSNGQAFREVVTKQWLPALAQFKPQLLIFSAGFDAHLEDKMGGLAWLEDDYQWITEQLKLVAHQHAKGRIVSVLEGGYALNALGRSAATHVKSLMD
ncbi:MAG: histone deacetylase family protein [Methylotenera sp.]|nr:histone deacetylase family protein [Methylotenera sp.]